MALLLALLLLAADPDLTLTVRPQVSFAPTSLVLTTRVQPDPRNRILCCVAVAGEFELRRSCFPTSDAVTYRVDWLWYETGTFEAVALLLRNDGSRREVRVPFEVR